MKKVILSALIVGSLMATSCKKTKEAAKDVKNSTENVANDVKEGAQKTVEATKEVAKDAADAVESAITGISIPKFEDPKLTEYVKSYTEYAKEYIDAKGDVLKSGLGEKGAKLAEQAKTAFSNLSPNDAKKYTEFMSAVNTKMHEATKK